MPTYRNQLPSRKAHMGFRIRRTPAAQTIGGICTCNALLVCDTHYWFARTTPCERILSPDGETLDDTPCAACQAKQPYRDHVYISVFDKKIPEHFLFECTCHAAEPLQAHIAAHGTLRGCAFIASRPHRTPNGRVEIITHAETLTKVALPPAPNVELALAVIWRLPLTGFALTDDRPGKRRQSVRRGGFNEMRNQLDNAADPAHVADVIEELNRKSNGQPVHQ